MSRNGAGVYSLPGAYNPVVTNTPITIAWANNTLTDVATALTNSIACNGETTITANLPMSTYKHTGIGNASARDQYAAAGQVQDSPFTWGGTAGGTADALTLTLNPPITAYAAGQCFEFIVGASPSATTTPTMAVNGLSAITFKRKDGSACVAGDLPAGNRVRALYDGTNLRLDSNPVAGSSSIITLGTVTTGTWNATIITGQYGGTGVANTGKTITLGGNLTTSGAFGTTITSTNTTSVTLPTSGTLISTAPSTSGNVLTSNGSAWVSQTPVGGGGATHTSSFTFSSGDPYSQKITPTTYGQAITFADATTFAKGAICSVWNNSDYCVAINDSTAVTRGFVGPWKTVIVGLADNSTAAGAWNIANSDILAVTASTFSTTTSGADAGRLQFISLDSDRSLFLYGSTTCLARVHRKSTNSWGAVTTVRASLGTQAFIGVKSATNQVLVCSNDTTTGMQAVVLSVDASTDAITANSAATAVLAGNWSSYGQLVVVGSYFVLSYGRATTTSGTRALSISGTTVTIGSELAVNTNTATAPQIYAVTSTVYLYSTADTTANTFATKPVTLSSTTTQTAGTGATTTIATSALYRMFAVGTRWHAFISGAGPLLTGVVVNVSGTTSTHSATSLSATMAQAPTTFSDAILISSSKSCVMSTNNSTTLYCNNLIDTAGTASAGTEITINTTTVGSSGVSAVSVSGNTCKFVATGTSVSNTLYTIDASGTSPVLSDLCESGNSVASINTPAIMRNTDSMGARDSRAVSSTIGIVTIPAAMSITNSAGVIYGARISYHNNILPIPGSNNSSGAAANGLNSNESWFYRCGPAGGINQIVKVEAAQP